MTASLDRPCAHVHVAIAVGVVHLDDVGRRQAEIRLWCEDCDEPFLWPDSVPVGVDLAGVARSLDGQELRVAIRSATDFPDHLTSEENS